MTSRLGAQGLTLEDLRLACVAANREGNLRELEFQDLVASLTIEELSAFIPQIFSLSTAQETKRDLAKALIGQLARLDPEEAVRIPWENNRKEVLKGQIGFEQAVYLWAEEKPEEAVAWAVEAEEQMRALPMDDLRPWNDFGKILGPLLNSLIQQKSSLAREVLKLVPELSPQHLIREALREEGMREALRTGGTCRTMSSEQLRFYLGCGSLFPKKWTEMD